MSGEKKRVTADVSITQAYRDAYISAIRNSKEKNPYPKDDPRNKTWQDGYKRGNAVRDFHSSRLTMRTGTSWFNNIEGL